jgi:hypothetical protein
MNMRIQGILLLPAVLWLTFNLVSCVSTGHLSTREISTTEAEAAGGTVALHTFGCRHPDDILNASFLDINDDAYDFEIFAPDFEYTIRRDVATGEALKKAEQFLECSFHYEQAQFRSILDPRGHLIGYEVRPLYSFLRFGTRDVLQIDYRINDHTVTIYIRLDPQVEALIDNEGRDDRDRR